MPDLLTTFESLVSLAGYAALALFLLLLSFYWFLLYRQLVRLTAVIQTASTPFIRIITLLAFILHLSGFVFIVIQLGRVLFA